MLLGADRCYRGVTGQLVLLKDITGRTGVMGGDAKGGAGPRLCSARPGGALDLGAQQGTQLLWVLRTALPGAPGLGRDPPTPPHFPAAPPSPDEVCGDRRSGPWKNTMEGPHKGGFIQICLEFSGFA